MCTGCRGFTGSASEPCTSFVAVGFKEGSPQVVGIEHHRLIVSRDLVLDDENGIRTTHEQDIVSKAQSEDKVQLGTCSVVVFRLGDEIAVETADRAVGMASSADRLPEFFRAVKRSREGLVFDVPNLEIDQIHFALKYDIGERVIMNIQLFFPWGLVGFGYDLPVEEIDLCLPEGTPIRHL
jgi:hypothetical protein